MPFLDLWTCSIQVQRVSNPLVLSLRQAEEASAEAEAQLPIQFSQLICSGAGPPSQHTELVEAL